MDEQFNERIKRVEELIAAIQEHGNPVVRASAVEMVRALLDLHRAGLAEILEQIVRQGEPGQGIMNQLVRHDLASRLLLLHGLHPENLETRLQHALDRVRPSLLACGATVVLGQVTPDVVHLQLSGGGSDERRLLETAILEAAPDVLRIEFSDSHAPALIALPLVRES